MPELTATRVVAQGGTWVKKARGYRLRTAERAIEVRGSHARIGTRADNEVALDDPAVSRLHATITRDETGYRFVDRGSRNGSHVDGLRVHDVYLRPGATITLGGTSLTFEPLETEDDVPLAARDSFGPLLGGSVAMRELYARLERVAPTDTTVLVTGESGTGKELVARALHDASGRAKGPFVVFDCAAVAASLLESELFGHERGAFTGATNRREGAASEADGGTLFLDEIGELPLELQPKLLRLLEQRELRRVGGTKTEPVDVRVVAATHRDLAAEVNRGTFREDLYYRLAVIELHVPPLRERRDDLPQLIRHLIERSVDGDATRASRVLDGLSPASWERLRAHTYPGNVRELRNLVERMLVLGDAAPEARPPAPSSTPTTGLASFVDPTREWMEQKRQLVGALEAAYLRAVLDAHDGNYTQAAAAAGIERMYFKRLLKKYEGA